MKKVIFFAAFLLSSSIAFSQAVSSEIIGIWETEKKDAKMEVFKNGDEYRAKLLWGMDIVDANGSSKKDINNPDKKLRSRDLVGIIYIKGLQFDGNQWNSGKVYNNSNGKWYKCYVWIKEGKLHLRGYLGLPIMGQTSKWNPVN